MLIYELWLLSELFLFYIYTFFSINKLTLLFRMVYKDKSAVYTCLKCFFMIKNTYERLV